MAEKKIYYGLDLLKFLMALMVVMIHVKPNTHSELLTAFFNPLMGLAVPTFFLISSYLIFSKLYVGGGRRFASMGQKTGNFVWSMVDNRRLVCNF